jgi:hypothetical protein
VDAPPLCAACGMRLSENEPDVVLRQLHNNQAGGVLRRYHPGCEASARRLLEEESEQWVVGLRFDREPERTGGA